jgi:hypothetical protein
MALRVWAPNTSYKQGDTVVVSNGAGGYMGDSDGAKTWLLCCVGTTATPDTSPIGTSGGVKTQNEWATLFEGNTTDGIIGEGTVMPATIQGNLSGPDGNIRWSCGVARFLDTSAPTNGNGAFATPWNTATAIGVNSISSQDGTNTTRMLYIKRGTTVMLTSAGATWIGRGTTRRHYTGISDYGTGPLPVLDASATTGLTAAIAISKSGANPSRYVLVENLEVINAAGEGISIFLGTGDAGIAQDNIVIRGVNAHHNGEAGIAALTGGNVDRTTSSTNLLIQNCISHHNGLTGIYAREWWDGVQILNNESYENGQDAIPGAYGISTIGNFQAYTGLTNWVNTSGTIWRRTMTRTNNIVVGRWKDQSGNERILTVDAGLTADYTITNTLGVIDVRLGPGDNPNTASTIVYVCYNRVKNIDIIGNKVYRTRDFRPGSNRFDGEGIGIDQFSQNVRVVRNVVSDNDGGGVIGNQPFNLYITGNSFLRNGFFKAEGGQVVAAVILNHPQNLCWVTNNTMAEGGGEGLRVYMVNGVATVTRNNLIYGNAGSGLFGTAAVSAITNTYNAIFGNTTPATNATINVTDSTADWSSFINENGAPKFVGYTYASPNPVATFGTYLADVTCLNGRAKPGWTPVGAWLGATQRSFRT